MPTAADFRSASALLVSDMETLGAIEIRMRTLDTGVTAGPYVQTAARGVAAGALNAAGARRATETVVTEFDRRAGVCEQYTVDMISWRTRYGQWEEAVRVFENNPPHGPFVHFPGAAPTQPTKEAIWVEES